MNLGSLYRFYWAGSTMGLSRIRGFEPYMHEIVFYRKYPHIRPHFTRSATTCTAYHSPKTRYALPGAKTLPATMTTPRCLCNNRVPARQVDALMLDPDLWDPGYIILM